MGSSEKQTTFMGRHAHANQFICFPICTLQLSTTKTCDKGGGSDHKSFIDTIILHGASTGCQVLEKQKQWNNILPSGAPSLVSHTRKEVESNTRMGQGPLRCSDCPGALFWTIQEYWGRALRYLGMRTRHLEDPGKWQKSFRNSVCPPNPTTLSDTNPNFSLFLKKSSYSFLSWYSPNRLECQSIDTNIHHLS